jgi:hypothetical protein
MSTVVYDLGLEFSGGTPMPTTEEAAAGYIPIAALDAVGEPTLVYGPATDIITADDTLATSLATHLRGAGLTVDSSGNLAVRQRPRYVQLRDFFITGTAASGSIGALGWNLLGSGTPAAARLSITTTIGNSGKLALSTSSLANERSVLTLGETETRDVAVATDLKILQCVWNHDNILTNKRVFFGLMGTFAAEAAAAVDCLGIYYDSAVSPNYQIIARASSVGSPTVTATAVPANSAELITIYQPTAGTYQFYTGNTLLGTISSGVPTAAMNLGFRIETLSAASKTVNLGYFGLDALPVATTAFDDDTFLEA